MKYTFALVLFLVIVGCILLEAKKKKKKQPPRKPRKTCEQGVCVINHRRSGKFSLILAGTNESSPQAMTISLSSIRELDDLGNVIGKVGPRRGKHSFNRFAGLDFNLTNIKKTKFKGVNAIAFTISARIPGPGALLQVPMHLFTEKGTLDVCGEEELSVKPGSLKFNIEIYNWRFCKDLECSLKGSKKKHFGAFLEIILAVKKKGRLWRGKKRSRKGKGKKWPKSKSKGKAMRTKAQKFFFAKSSISLPSSFESDGNCTTMPEGYPKVWTTKRGVSYKAYLRFPKFNRYVKYDPLLDLVDSESPAVSNSSANATAAPDEPETEAPSTSESATEKPTTCAPSITNTAHGKSNADCNCNSSSGNIGSLECIAVALIVIKGIWIWG